MTQQYLFDINEISEHEQRRQIDEARDVIVEYLKQNPGKRAGVYFSCGKDSLLTAVLAVEASERLGIEPPCLFSSIVPYEVENAKLWFNHLVDNITGVQWRAAEPAPFMAFGVKVLGIGTIPPLLHSIKWCNTAYKKMPLDTLVHEYKNDFVFFTGIRSEESIKRRKRFEEQGYYIKDRNYVTPIIKIEEPTLWQYLKHNLYKIGIDYELLRLEYAQKQRSGCWFCPSVRSYGDNSLTSDIVKTLRGIFYLSERNTLLPFPGDEINDGQQYVRRFDQYAINDGVDHYRTQLRFCKQWYDELIELQNKYQRHLLTDLHKKMIFELWNWRTLINERITQADFLNTYFSGQYKALYPELFDVVFRRVGKRYCYIRGVLKEIKPLL